MPPQPQLMVAPMARKTPMSHKTSIGQMGPKRQMVHLGGQMVPTCQMTPMGGQLAHVSGGQMVHMDGQMAPSGQMVPIGQVAHMGGLMVPTKQMTPMMGGQQMIPMGHGQMAPFGSQMATMRQITTMGHMTPALLDRQSGPKHPESLYEFADNVR